MQHFQFVMDVLKYIYRYILEHLNKNLVECLRDFYLDHLYKNVRLLQVLNRFDHLLILRVHHINIDNHLLHHIVMEINQRDHVLLMMHRMNEVNEVIQYYLYMNHQEMVELNDEYMYDQVNHLHLNQLMM